jgi:hypothetical protein
MGRKNDGTSVAYSINLAHEVASNGKSTMTLGVNNLPDKIFGLENS